MPLPASKARSRAEPTFVDSGRMADFLTAVALAMNGSLEAV
jgi:hypothetical protein